MAFRTSSISALVVLLLGGQVGATEYVYETLRFPGSIDTFAHGLTNDDVVVGTYYVEGSDEAHGFVWENGIYEAPELDLPLFDVSFNGINDHYDIVGTAIVPLPVDPFIAIPSFFLFDNEVFPFEYPGALATYVDDVNDNLDVVGSFRSSLEDDLLHAFYMFGDEYKELTIPDFFEVFAIGINNQGQIVGGAYDAVDEESGFIFDEEGVTLFNHPDGQTELVDINNSGMLAGTVADGNGLRAFVFDGEDFHDVMFPGATETAVWSINDLGAVVGEYMPAGSDAYSGFVAWPVPEPSSWLLVCFAMLAPAFMRARPNLQ